ncbi:zinc-ribbon domain-containing protein, partial [Paraburkholderia sp.]|uniref:zinc-ribbon domain-containing protein n=1 Tax=Paraburkholderia sp. TaxID=1926495 RepID=UPI0039E3EADF
MLLATRCPFCETVFSLQPAQLAQRRGLVRCGHCQEVFDASSSLFDVTEGGDFSQAKPVAAAAAIEALSGVRQQSADFSAEARDPWAPAAGGASSSTLDDRLHDNAVSMPLAPLPLGDSDKAPPAPAASRTATEPELPAGGFTAPLPADQEPTLADAPLEPFAYPADELPAVAVSPATSSANIPAAAAAVTAAQPRADDAPRVWHKTERAESSTLDEPMLDEPALRDPASLYGMPDNEPRFGTAAGLGAAAGFGTAASGAATGGPGGP